jgi:hypothetical protein
MDTPSSIQPSSSQPKSYVWINTRSAHQVKLWIRQGIADGRLKDCWNLWLAPIDVRDENGIDRGESYFIPACKCQSLESNFAHIDDENQMAMLQHNLGSNPVSCPKDCTCCANRKKAFARSRLKVALRYVRVGWKASVKAFFELKTPQVIVIGMAVLLIVIWKAPKLLPLVESLVKSILGKS